MTKDTTENHKPLQPTPAAARQAWVEPDVRQLELRETSAFPNLGADVGGNPSPDCQRS